MAAPLRIKSEHVACIKAAAEEAYYAQKHAKPPMHVIKVHSPRGRHSSFEIEPKRQQAYQRMSAPIRIRGVHTAAIKVRRRGGGEGRHIMRGAASSTPRVEE